MHKKKHRKSLDILFFDDGNAKYDPLFCSLDCFDLFLFLFFFSPYITSRVVPMTSIFLI